MLVERKSLIEAEKFQVGDIISFTRSTGEKVEAMAMKVEDSGTTFLLVNALEKAMSMNRLHTTEGGYVAAEIRRALNEDILETFPEDIRKRMVPMEDGDLLRLPTEREVFGTNDFGEEEPETVEQWEPMKAVQNRICGLGVGAEEPFPWWLSSVANSTGFCLVGWHGIVVYGGAGNSHGVRPRFKIV